MEFFHAGFSELFFKAFLGDIPENSGLSGVVLLLVRRIIKNFFNLGQMAA